VLAAVPAEVRFGAFLAERDHPRPDRCRRHGQGSPLRVGKKLDDILQGWLGGNMSDLLEAMERRRANPKMGRAPWVSIAVSAALLVVWLLAGRGVLAQSEGSESIPFAVLAIILAIVGFFESGFVWLCAYFLVVRKSRPRWGLRLFIGLLALALLINLQFLLSLTR